MDDQKDSKSEGNKMADETPKPRPNASLLAGLISQAFDPSFIGLKRPIENSDSGTDEEGAATQEKPENGSSKTKKRKKKDKDLRKNIRKIKDDLELDKETQDARKEEQERLERLRMRNFVDLSSDGPDHVKKPKPVDDDSDDDIICMGEVTEAAEEEDTANSGMHTNDDQNKPDQYGRVLANVNHPQDEEGVYLATQIQDKIKPHQIGGIRFMYDNTIESLKRCRTSAGFGCVLAHAMGLGKTLQVISFADVFLRHSGHKYVMIIVPVNTIQNWKSEFATWLPERPASSPPDPKISYRTSPVYCVDERCNSTDARLALIKGWRSTGGCLIVGYETFRILVTPKKVKKNSPAPDQHQILMLQECQNHLLDPGADLVICDEGHRIKNEKAELSKALSKIRTKRRVILTGTPLQNNLIEYWTMVDFVRPRLLGSKNEFQNMFVAPITNGQAKNATPDDRRQMKYRSHVLHELLKGCVQRRSHAVLCHDLPAKNEYILMVRLSQQQIPYYQKFTQLKSDDNEEGSMNAVVAHATCSKIWNHPDLLYRTAVQGDDSDARELDDEFDHFDAGFIKPKGKPKSKKELKASVEWARKSGIREDYTPGHPEAGFKVPLLLNILRKSALKGEKLICFSQRKGLGKYRHLSLLCHLCFEFRNSLGTLDLLGDFITADPTLPLMPGELNWAGRIMRIDGSCGSMEREKIIKKFTDFPLPSILLISTRAGCVGINVTAATRVVMFDVSWNPVHDAQAVCRIYRIGQEKACFIYRLVADGCMERAIYERQTSLSRRIVDEKNIDRLRVDSNRALLIFQDQSNFPPPLPMTAEEAGDSVIEEVSRECGKYLSHTPIKMESLIVESKQQLTASEKRIAKRQYESEKNTSGGYGCGRGRPRMEHRPIAHVRPFQSGNSPHGHSNLPPGMGSHHHSTAGIPSWRHAAMNLARQGTPPFNHQNSPNSLLGGLPFGSNPLLSPRHSSSPGCDGSSIQSMSRETVSFGPSIPSEEQNFLNDFPVRGGSSSQNGSSSNAVIPPPSDPLPFPNLLGNNFNQPRLDNVSSIMQFLKDGYSSSAALDLQRHRERTSLNLSSIIPQAPPGGTIDIIDSD